MVLLITGVGMVFVRYGGVDGLGVWFWVKMAFVALVIVMMILGALLKPGTIKPVVQMWVMRIALIGIILLIGIVKKNAIMMIDVAIHLERDENRNGQEAIHEAAVIRLRPIMMTTAAAVLGAVPLAIGIGQGASLRQPLGITVMGGLILSQIFTLYTTPVIYLLLDRLRLRLANVASRLPWRDGRRPGLNA